MAFLWFQHSSKQIWVESPWIPRCHHKFLRCPVRIFQAQFHGGYGFSTGESYGNGVGTGMNMCSMLSLLSYIHKMYVYIYIHTRICISATYIYHNICSNTQKDGTVIYHYFSRIFLLLSLWGCYIYICTSFVSCQMIMWDPSFGRQICFYNNIYVYCPDFWRTGSHARRTRMCG